MAYAITRFTGEYSFLSNFYLCSVMFEGMLYPSVEHAFQAAKTLDIDERKIIRSYSKPSCAKALGRRLNLRSDWEDIKIDIMTSLVRDKFTRNKDMRDALLSTHGAFLEEGNHHGDTFWGTVDGKGYNELGKILMQIRFELHQELLNKSSD